MVFKITMQGNNARKATDDWSYNDSFYTNPGGYKMCIEVVPNGDLSSKDTNVSMYAKVGGPMMLISPGSGNYDIHTT